MRPEYRPDRARTPPSRRGGRISSSGTAKEQANRLPYEQRVEEGRTGPRSTAQVHRLALLHCQLHFSRRHIVDSDLYPVTPPFTHPTVPVRPAIEELNGYRAG